ncbi:hypothetical protein X279_02360 [Oenococcus oeni IOEB_0501]|nr:hypothetical protein X279_02360 [Oenococcus oeni IOEB_0501]
MSAINLQTSVGFTAIQNFKKIEKFIQIPISAL